MKRRPRRAESALRSARCWLIQSCLLFWVGLASSLAAESALDISGSHRLDLSRHVQVCPTTAQARIEQILAAGCAWDPDRPPSVSRGFDQRAFWLRFDLVNLGSVATDRLLSVGHARLQEVSLFQLPEAGPPVALGYSGSTVALNAKPVPLPRPRPRPSFRLAFAAGERKTLWLRIASETIIEFAPELQPLEAGYYQAQRLQLFQALAIGCMLLCFCYSAATYLMLRESTLLFFGLFMLGEIVVELTRSGLLATYLWPASLPFDSRVLTLGTAASIGAFSLFLSGFIAGLRHHPLIFGLYRSTLAVFYGGVFWSLFVDYRTGALLWSYATIAWMLSVLVLALLSWRRGSPTAKLLLQGFMLLAAIELLRILSVIGMVDFSEIEALGNPVAIALTSAVILVGMIRRVREMQSTLSRTQAERAASLSFMSQMSHELRSPLATIIGQLKLLVQTGLPERARQMADTMRLDAAQLLSMIDDILEYAQGTAGKQRLHCTAQRWSGLAARIEQRASVLTQGHGNRFVFRAAGPEPAVFLVDERRLLQVLSNLLTNAAHYCQDGVIELDCRIEQDPMGRDWNLRFSVCDTGPGIAPEDQQRIFQPFERGNEAHLSDHKGMGMGLAISRQLVESMGGQLTLHSEPAQGCRFSFDITCRAAQPDEVEWGADEAASWSVVATSGLDASPPAPARVERPFPVPDPHHLVRLLHLVDNGQISDLLEMTDLLEQQDPGLGPFCATVRDLALQLDLAQLRRLCT